MKDAGAKFDFGSAAEEARWQREYARIVGGVRAEAAAGAAPATRHVGHSIPRLDVLYKVRGKARFAANIALPGMLHGRFVRSDQAHARLKRVDPAAARRAPGVRAVLTAADIPEDRLLVGPLFDDTPILARDRVRYIGEPIAAIAADTEAAAESACQLVEVEYEPLEAILSPETALAADAPRLHADGNVIADFRKAQGDVEAALARADVVVEGTFTNAPIEHCYLEAQGGVAFVDDDGVLTLLVCTQYPHFHHKQLARVTGRPMDKVRVIQTAIGGAFGGKIDVTVECASSLLALATGRPVKMTLERPEVFTATTKRHAMRITERLGATRDGRLSGLDVRILCDGGAYHSYSMIVAGRMVIHTGIPYDIPDMRTHLTTAFTNHVPSGAMRSFGVVKIAFANESLLNEIADRLGMSPIEIRRLNGLGEGSRASTGQVLEDVGYLKTLDAIQPIYEERRRAIAAERASGLRLGLGVASLGYGIGYSGVPNPAVARMSVDADGTVTAYCGTPDIGTGSDTALAQIVADAAGVAIERMRIVSGDSTKTDDAGPTSASRTTYFCGNAGFTCARDFRANFEAAVAAKSGTPPEFVHLANDEVLVNNRPMPFAEACRLIGAAIDGVTGYGKFDPEAAVNLETFMGRPYPTYTYATHLAEVEVDEALGSVSVRRYWAAHDAGRVVNPMGAEGQIEGGVAMGIGMALFEKIVREDGRILNPTYADYLLPGTMDVPTEISTIFVDNDDRSGPFGAKGIAEASIIPTPAAIAAAVHDAVGVWPRRLPMDSEYILSLLRGGADMAGRR